jgi:hypothetical protein
LPAPLWIPLLVKLGEPVDCTLCGKASVVAQVQVTVPLTATVSTAGLDDPLSALLKKMSPTVTAAVAGAVVGGVVVGGVVVGGVVVGGVVVGGVLGEVVESELSSQPASRLPASMPHISSMVT